jgi:hypothetical protein
VGIKDLLPDCKEGEAMSLASLRRLQFEVLMELHPGLDVNTDDHQGQGFPRNKPVPLPFTKHILADTEAVLKWAVRYFTKPMFKSLISKNQDFSQIFKDSS